VLVAIGGGQAGLLISVLWAVGNGNGFESVIRQNLANASLYTFCISLLASGIVPLAVEYLDTERSAQKIYLRTEKTLACFAAAALIIASASMASGITANLSRQTAPVPWSLVGAGTTVEGIIWLLSILLAIYLIAIARLHMNADDIAAMARASADKLAGEAHSLQRNKDGEEL
jgi:hypothetical protein